MVNNPLEFFVQGLVLVIVIGSFYSLYSTTKAYGGLIGRAIRLLGTGMLFVVIAVIEKNLLNFDILQASVTLSLAQDLLNLLGILFLGLGFSRLAAAAKV
jgi:hypothetical protein